MCAYMDVATYLAGIVFVLSDAMLPVEWESSNFLARQVACYLFSYFLF